MAQISTADFKNGMTLDLDDGLFQISEFQHVKPGKGGAFVRTTLQERPHRRSGRPDLPRRREDGAGDRRPGARCSCSTATATTTCSWTTATYDQLNVASDTLGEAADFLVDNATAQLLMYGDEIIGVDLPASVELDVAETEPGVQGDRVSGAKKPATLDTGRVVQVPLFIDPGETVKVDTRSGEFISRA